MESIGDYNHKGVVQSYNKNSQYQIYQNQYPSNNYQNYNYSNNSTTYKKNNYQGNHQNYKKNNQGQAGVKQYGRNEHGNYNKNSKIFILGRHVHYDPYQAQLLLYRAEIYICSRYPNLIDINSKNSGLTEKLSDKCQFFVIKSFSEEDVHKAVKYKVWSSTLTGNKTLSNAYNITKEQKGEVYLFYSCNGSGRFIGVAKMASPVDEENTFMYWTQDSKWKGLFDIDWVFIKDVPFKAFKNINITMKDSQVKPVTYSRDTQQIPFEEGKKMLGIVETFINSNTILEHFEYYDLRQENYEKTLQMSGQQN